MIKVCHSQHVRTDFVMTNNYDMGYNMCESQSLKPDLKDEQTPYTRSISDNVVSLCLIAQCRQRTDKDG